MRLQQTNEFDTIRNQGQRAAKGCIAMNWLSLPQGGTSKLGLITSRKLGRATVRSRARRLLRETFRLHQHDFSRPVAMVLVARNSIIGKGLADVERDFLFLARQAKLLKTDE